MASLKHLSKEEIDILYSFANDENCRYVYDWQGFNYEEICPLIDKLIKENKKYKEVIDKLSSQIKLYGKYNGEKCTRGFSMMAADFNKLLNILKEVNK